MESSSSHTTISPCHIIRHHPENIFVWHISLKKVELTISKRLFWNVAGKGCGSAFLFLAASRVSFWGCRMPLVSPHFWIYWHCFMAGFHLHFSLKIYYRLFFFIHSLEPIIHSSCVHSDALKIAAIIGDLQNSTLLTAQPEANQKSSFAQHNSHPSRSNCSITCRLLFSPHCFSFWIHLVFLLLLGSFPLSFLAACSPCAWTVLFDLTIHLINYLVSFIKNIKSFVWKTTLNSEQFD